MNDYSQKVNTNAVNIALLTQRMDVTEARVEEYHTRLHKAEDRVLTIGINQEIHDTQIKGFRKLLVGNGDSETLPMDIIRLENNISRLVENSSKIDPLRVAALEAKVEDIHGMRLLVRNNLISGVLGAVVAAVITRLV